MPLEMRRARQIALRVPAVDWAILALAAEAPWLDEWLRNAPLEQVAAWAREALANWPAPPPRPE
jgi:hypothetical protein